MTQEGKHINDFDPLEKQQILASMLAETLNKLGNYNISALDLLDALAVIGQFLDVKFERMVASEAYIDLLQKQTQSA